MFTYYYGDSGSGDPMTESELLILLPADSR